MMQRHEAFHLHCTTRDEVLNFVRPWLLHRFDENAHIGCLRSARDCLYEACSQFEREDGSMVHEDLYLPLFDALSCINCALGVRPIRRKLIHKAEQCLTAPLAPYEPDCCDEPLEQYIPY